MRFFATCANIQSNLVNYQHLLFSFDRGTIVEKNLVQTPASQLSLSFDQLFIIHLLFKGRTSLYDRVGVPSNADKTSEYETPVENEHQGSGNETDARVDRLFYEDVATNAKKSEEISAEGNMFKIPLTLVCVIFVHSKKNCNIS